MLRARRLDQSIDRLRGSAHGGGLLQQGQNPEARTHTRVYFITFAAFFILTEIGREIYRPYVYQNGINDLGSADAIGNLPETVAVIFFSLGVSLATPIQSIRIVAFVTVGITIYELLQPVLPRDILDWNGVASTPIAGLLSLMIVLAVWTVVKDPLAPDVEQSVGTGALVCDRSQTANPLDVPGDGVTNPWKRISGGTLLSSNSRLVIQLYTPMSAGRIHHHA